MKMSEFYSAVYEGTINEVADYIRGNFEDCQWDCPTGIEDVEGIIDVLSAEPEIAIEIDYNGNIRCKGDVETFANIVKD